MNDRLLKLKATAFSALRNKVLWYLFSRYATMGVQFVTSIYIAVKLGAYYFGIWSFVLLLVNIGNQFNWGIGNAVNILYVQHKQDETACRGYCYNAVLLTLLVMLPVLAFTLYERVFGLVYFQKYHLGNMIYAVALIVCLNYLNSLFMNISRVRGNLAAITFNQSVFPVLTLVLMFCADGMTLLRLLIGGYAAAMLLSVAAYLLERPVDWSRPAEPPVMRTIAAKGFFLFCYNACFYLIVLSTKTIVSYYYPVESFGYFAFAFSLASAVLMMVDSFTFVAFPKMIDMMRSGDPEEIRRKIVFLRQCYFVVIGAAVYLAIPACYFLLKFIPKYRPAFSCFVMILLALAVYPLCYGCNTYMLARNQERLMSGLVGGACLGNILLSCFAAGCLQVEMEDSVCGIMISYFVYAQAVNFCAWRHNGGRFGLPALRLFCPLYVIAPIAVSLVCLKVCPSLLLWLPLVCFLLLGWRACLGTITPVLKIIRNPSMLNVC